MKDMWDIFGKNIHIRVEFVDMPQEVLLMKDVDRIVIIMNSTTGILAWINGKSKIISCADAPEFYLGGFRYNQVCQTCGLGISNRFRINEEEKLAFDNVSEDNEAVRASIQKACMERMHLASEKTWKSIFAKCAEMKIEKLFLSTNQGRVDVLT